MVVLLPWRKTPEWFTPPRVTVPDNKYPKLSVQVWMWIYMWNILQQVLFFWCKKKGTYMVIGDKIELE